MVAGDLYAGTELARPIGDGDLAALQNLDFADAEAGSISPIVCNPRQQVGIPKGTILIGGVSISDCVIGVGANVFMSDVVLASLSDGNPGG